MQKYGVNSLCEMKYFGMKSFEPTPLWSGEKEGAQRGGK